MAGELPELLIPNASELRDWLTENHALSPGVHLILTKSGGAVTELTYEEAVNEGLCFGWIDGQASSRDDQTYRVRFTPRTARSNWSQKNVQRVAELEARGRITDAGLAAIEAAKADGRWDMAYAGPATAQVPDDLAAAVAAVPAAQAMFDVLTSQNRFAMISRLVQLKTEAARQRNIDKFVAMLARHETPYPQKRMPRP